jgi:hypothetical protein
VGLGERDEDVKSERKKQSKGIWREDKVELLFEILYC